MPSVRLLQVRRQALHGTLVVLVVLLLLLLLLLLPCQLLRLRLRLLLLLLVLLLLLRRRLLLVLVLHLLLLLLLLLLLHLLLAWLHLLLLLLLLLQLLWLQPGGRRSGATLVVVELLELLAALSRRLSGPWPEVLLSIRYAPPGGGGRCVACRLLRTRRLLVLGVLRRSWRVGRRRARR